jgi:hypothetical protein
MTAAFVTSKNLVRRIAFAAAACALPLALCCPALAMPSPRATVAAAARAPAPLWTPHHLYVGVEVAGRFGGGPNVIYRYPIDGSIIATRPDLVYPNQAGPLAVDSAGNLYAGNGSFSLFATFDVSAFHPNQTTAFTSYQMPNPGFSAYVTSMALDPRGYLALGYVSFVTSSAPRDIRVAGIRLAGHKTMNDTVIGGGDSFYAPAITGMTIDAHGHLFVAIGGHVQIYDSISGATLEPIGSLQSTVFHLPAGLAVAGSTLLALDLPIPQKITVSSYPVSARGTVTPLRLLRPLGPDDSTYDSGSGPIDLPYQIGVNGRLLYVPYFTVGRDGRRVTGVYEFEKGASGTVRALQSLFVIASGAGPTYIVDAAVVGP